MELDCIRSSGNETCVSLWIEGKMRAITVSPQAVGTWLSRSGPVSEEDCRNFVATRLAFVQNAARQKLLQTDPSAGAVLL